MIEVQIILFVVVLSITALAVRWLGQGASPPNRRGSRVDSEPHRSWAEVDAEVEEHDIDDMLDAVAERRRRRGGREIGEELGDELMRGTWDDK